MEIKAAILAVLRILDLLGRTIQFRGRKGFANKFYLAAQMGLLIWVNDKA